MPLREAESAGAGYRISNRWYGILNQFFRLSNLSPGSTAGSHFCTANKKSKPKKYIGMKSLIKAGAGLVCLLTSPFLHAQYVGIGMDNPIYNLDVAGTIHSTSGVYSDYIIKANNYLQGVSGVRIGSGTFTGGYKLHLKDGDSYFGGDGIFTGSLTTQGIHYINGNAVIGGNIQLSGNLWADGNINGDSDMRVYGYTALGGNIDENYRLRVYNGNARIGGDFHATGNGAIGGEIDPTWRFRVYGGNSRFGGNVQVTGNLEAGSINTNIINGNGAVTSNGNS